MSDLLTDMAELKKQHQQGQCNKYCYFCRKERRSNGKTDQKDKVQVDTSKR